MMRFYHMTEKQVLSMRLKRFVALYKAINHIQLEEEALQLSIVHNGKPGDRFKEIQQKLYKMASPASPPISSLILLATPGVGVEKEAGSIEALRARQKESNERIKREWEEQKAQGAKTELPTTN